MTSTIENSASKSVASWYLRAAWYSLLVPLTSPVWGFLLFAFTNGYLGIMMALAFWILVSGFILGLTSLLGIAKCGPGRILWKAGIGIPLNAILSFFSYAYWGMSHGFHG
jgi:hypothetical protein